MVKNYWTASQLGEIRESCKQYQLPTEVEERMISTVEVLDKYYGTGRRMEDDGGYVALIVEDDEKWKVQEYKDILHNYHLSKEEREFQDILCSDKQGVYYAELFIASSEYAITIIWCQERK